MKNITAYAERYQDSDFDSMPFSEVDGAVLCQLSYYDYEDERMQEEGFCYPICELLEKDPQSLLKGMLTVNGDEELIEVVRKGGRHGSLKIANYVNQLDLECDQQFSAMTFELEKGVYFIAYRGTDNSVVGWKEDFNLSYQKEIPSQKAAIAYAMNMMKKYGGRFYLGGHSKGGNLAVYTAMMLPKEQRNRLECVYNYDGPGFFGEVYEKEEYRNVRTLIRKIIPQGSVVGMLLEEDNNYCVIQSDGVGLMQHNLFTWRIEDDRFEILEDVDSVSNLLKGTMNRWMKEMETAERKQFVDAVFDIIYSMGVHTLNEMTSNKKEKIRKLLQYLSHIDAEERKMIFATFGRLFQVTAREARKLRKRSKPKTANFKIN